MTIYLPTARKFENLHQELECLRGRAVDLSKDIDVPSYIVDQAILCAVRNGTASYLHDYLHKYPTHVSKFFYQETINSMKPPRKTITICPLLYYAIRSNAFECIRVLLLCGASAFQPSYIIEWNVNQNGDSEIEIVEKPTIEWLAELIMKNNFEISARVLHYFKQTQVEFTQSLQTRIQRLDIETPLYTKAKQYHSVWHCLDKITEKLCPKEEWPDRKEALKQLRSAYAMDTLEAIFKEGKIKRKVKDPEVPEEVKT